MGKALLYTAIGFTLGFVCAKGHCKEIDTIASNVVPVSSITLNSDSSLAKPSIDTTIRLALKGYTNQYGESVDTGNVLKFQSADGKEYYGINLRSLDQRKPILYKRTNVGDSSVVSEIKVDDSLDVTFDKDIVSQYLVDNKQNVGTDNVATTNSKLKEIHFINVYRPVKK